MLLLIGVLLLLMPVVSSGQTLLHLKQNPDPSSISMGGSLTYLNPAYASFGNVAALSFDESSGAVAAGYCLWSPEIFRSDQMTLSGSFKIGNKIGVSAGFGYMYNDKYEVMDPYGNYVGTYRPVDGLLRTGCACRFLPYLSAGINMSYALSSLSSEHYYNAFATDLFLMARINSLKATLGLTNFGLSWNHNQIYMNLPTSVTVSCAYDCKFMENHCAAAEIKADVFINGKASIACGLMYSWKNMLDCRLGYCYGSRTVMSSSISGGLSCNLYRCLIGLSYSLYLNNESTGLIAVSIGYSFQ